MSRTAWSLKTEDEVEVFFFEVNPKVDSGSLGVSKGISYSVAAGPSGRAVVHETIDGPQQVSYSGVLLSQSQYDDLIEWCSKEEPLILTDDLGQSSLIFFKSLEYTRAPKRHYPFRHEFSFTAYVLEVL